MPQAARLHHRFDGPEGARWLTKGLGILARQIPEQILADGGHFERSTMYHALALEDILDLINVSRPLGDGLSADYQISFVCTHCFNLLLILSPSGRGW